MLVLSRALNESIIIGDDIVITVVAILGDKLRIGVEAPKEVPIHREEVHLKLAYEQATGQVLDPAEIRKYLRARARGDARGEVRPGDEARDTAKDRSTKRWGEINEHLKGGQSS